MPERLDAIRERLSFMVSGRMEALPPDENNSEPTVWCEDVHKEMVELMETPTLDMAEFIAHAPADLAYLLDRLAKAEAVVLVAQDIIQSGVHVLGYTSGGSIMIQPKPLVEALATWQATKETG